MKNRIIFYSFWLSIAVTALYSCEKPALEEEPRILQEDEELELDTKKTLAATCWNIYCYAKQIYFWNDFLPPIKEFDPKKYAENMEATPNTALQHLLKAIAKYSNGDDRFSTIMAGENLVAGLSVPAMLSPFVEPTLGYSSLSYGGFPDLVTQVYPGSPADKAGLKRGDIISFILLLNGSTYKAYVKSKNVMKTMIMEPDINNYSEPTVTKDIIVSVESYDHITKKVGYLLYNGFDSDKLYDLEFVFHDFMNDAVTELVLDLRYNKGGSIFMVNNLFNLIASQPLAGEDMLGHNYNKTIISGDALLLKKQSDKKLFENVLKASNDKYIVESHSWALKNIKNIYVIVSNQTTSASEILIKALKYYADKGKFGLKLIGKQTKGKGFASFDINVNGYTIKLMSSRVWTGELGNFVPTDGIGPDYNCKDDLTHELGDPEEACFAAALKHIKSGSWP